jgi:alpha-beta hydrolase superfamily lysophospholipase
LYRSWLPKKRPDKAVILFHSANEHSGRWQDVVEKLDLVDIAFYAWDARGHGRSPGERGYAESFATLVKDVDSFIRYVSTSSGIPHERMIVIGRGSGSVLAAAWVHDYAPPIRALVLGSPALRLGFPIPLAIPLLRLMHKVRGKTVISCFVKGRLLTHDPVKRQSYDEDPLITPKIAVNILLGLHDTATRLMRDAGAIALPVLILSSGADFLVSRCAQRCFYDRLPDPRKEMQSFPGFFHDIFNEFDSARPIAKARMFIKDVFARPYRPLDLLNADRGGYTRDEFDRLNQPLPAASAKRFGFALTRFLMGTAGRLSRGITIGWRAGFDSGAMLDYVYANHAQGSGMIGRLIDRAYLDSPSWKGIRQRKINLERMIADAIARVLAESGEARLCDIAAGHGRYVLDALQAAAGKPVSALLRDSARPTSRPAGPWSARWQ